MRLRVAVSLVPVDVVLIAPVSLAAQACALVHSGHGFLIGSQGLLETR